MYWVFTGTRPRSVIVEFTMTEAHDVVLSKSQLLRYSKLCYIGIVQDTPGPQKHLAAPIFKPNVNAPWSEKANSLLQHRRLGPRVRSIKNQQRKYPTNSQALARMYPLHHPFVLQILFPALWDQKKGEGLADHKKWRVIT